MQTIFERSHALAHQLAEEVGNQHKRLQFEKAEAELQMENIRVSYENTMRQIDTGTDATIRDLRNNADALKKRVTEEADERLRFQAHRVAQIEEQLRAYLPPEQEAA